MKTCREVKQNEDHNGNGGPYRRPLPGGDWFALFKLTLGIARNALAVMGTAKSVTTGTTYSAETGNGRIGEGSADHEQ